MPRGRPKKPLDKLARSTIAKNPNRYRHLRVVAPGVPQTPPKLTEAERVVYGELVRDLAAAGVLESHHALLLTCLAVEWVAYRSLPVESPDRDKTFSRVLKLLRECGLTPASFASIQRPRDKFLDSIQSDADDPFEKMFRETYGPKERALHDKTGNPA